MATTTLTGWILTYACHTAFVHFRVMWEVVMQFHLATAVAVMGLITVVAVYFVWVRKFDKQETEIENLQSQIKKAQEREFKERKDLDSYLGALVVE